MQIHGCCKTYADPHLTMIALCECPVLWPEDTSGRARRWTLEASLPPPRLHLSPSSPRLSQSGASRLREHPADASGILMMHPDSGCATVPAFLPSFVHWARTGRPEARPAGLPVRHKALVIHRNTDARPDRQAVPRKVHKPAGPGHPPSAVD
jgi:hypothetical protein